MRKLKSIVFDGGNSGGAPERFTGGEYRRGAICFFHSSSTVVKYDIMDETFLQKEHK